VDAAEVLEAAEGVLDEVSAATTFLIVVDGALAAFTSLTLPAVSINT